MADDVTNRVTEETSLMFQDYPQQTLPTNCHCEYTSPTKQSPTSATLPHRNRTIKHLLNLKSFFKTYPQLKIFLKNFFKLKIIYLLLFLINI